jgi:hypothetical protein
MCDEDIISRLMFYVDVSHSLKGEQCYTMNNEAANLPML